MFTNFETFCCCLYCAPVLAFWFAPLALLAIWGVVQGRRQLAHRR